MYHLPRLEIYIYNFNSVKNRYNKICDVKIGMKVP